MVVINATNMMVAFYDDHPCTIARFVETFFEGDKPQHPFSRERTVFEGMALVFPELKPLILPLHSIHSADEVVKVSFNHVRYRPFTRWRDIRNENPQTTLVVMDYMQNLEISPIIVEWTERRFPTILWSHVLELENGKSAHYGEEHKAHFEFITFRLYEPGWKEWHDGHVRFDAGTLKPIEVSEIHVQLEQPTLKD